MSPADGVVLHYGKVEEERIEYVKGHDYDVATFIGEPYHKRNVLFFQSIWNLDFS